MGSGYSIKPSEVRAAARVIRGNGEALRAAVERLRVRVTGPASPWGNAELTMVAEAYAYLTDLALDKFGQVAARLPDVADALDAVAAQKERDDDAAFRDYSGLLR